MNILQHIVKPLVGVGLEEALFFRRSKEAYFSIADDYIQFDEDGYAEFDTFFNLFSAASWLGHTDIKRMGLHLKISGSFRISLQHKKYVGKEVITTVLSEENYETDADTEAEDIYIPYESLHREGIYSFSLMALTDDSRFYGGDYYTADAPARANAYVPGKVSGRRILSGAALKAEAAKLVSSFPENTGSLKNMADAGRIQALHPEVLFRMAAFAAYLKADEADQPLGFAVMEFEHPWLLRNKNIMWKAGMSERHRLGLDVRYLNQCFIYEKEKIDDIRMCGIGLWAADAAAQADHFVLQHILYPEPSVCAEESLYFRRQGPSRYSFANSDIVLEDRSMLSTDTFFGVFPADVWNRYTDLEKIGLKLTVKGSFRVTILHKMLVDQHIKETVIGEFYCDTLGIKDDIFCEIDLAASEGFYSFSLLSLQNGAVYYGAEYFAMGRAKETVSPELTRDTDEMIESSPGERISALKSLAEAYPVRLKGLTDMIRDEEKLRTHAEVVFRARTLLSFLNENAEGKEIAFADLWLDYPWILRNGNRLWKNGMADQHRLSLDVRDTYQCLLYEANKLEKTETIKVCGIGLWGNEDAFSEKYRALQHVLYPQPSVCAEEAMYFRRKGPSRYSFADTDIILEDRSLMTNDTFFGAFSAGFWTAHTDLQQIGLKLTVNGSFRVTLLHKVLVDKRIKETVIGEFYCDTLGVKDDIYCAFDLTETDGIYCYSLLSLRNGSKYYTSEYFIDQPEHMDISPDLEAKMAADVIDTQAETAYRLQMMKGLLTDQAEEAKIVPARLRSDEPWCAMNERIAWDTSRLDLYPVLDMRRLDHVLYYENPEWSADRYLIRVNGLAQWGEEKHLTPSDDHVILQHVLYPNPEICTVEEMFFRRNGATRYSYADDDIVMDNGATLTTDTYFGGFSAYKWSKYTRISNLGLHLCLKGAFRVSLMHAEKLPGGVRTQNVGEFYLDTCGVRQDIYCKYNFEQDQGIYYFILLSMSNGAVYYHADYYTDMPAAQLKDVSLAINICTFKREKYIYRNMNALRGAFLDNPDSELYGRLQVLISDNAASLDPARIDHPAIHMVTNKNAGGAAGFTRGMIEAIKRNAAGDHITHIQMMDDDIVMEPEAIYRTYRLLTMLKDTYADTYIGGAMFRTDNQWFQTEAGAQWNAGRLVSHKSGLDVRSLESCLYNDFEEKCEFNAWWYCTVPMKYVREDNLPLPIFIRGDDVEYGLRNMEHLILLNGICVWHLPFEFKYSSSMYYYIFRNRLIDNAVHEKGYDEKKFLKDFKAQFYREVFTLRYKNAQLLLDGVYDFYKGVDWLKAQDGEALNKDIMSRGYQMQYVDELSVPFDYPAYDQTIHYVEGRKHQLMRKLTMNGIYQKPYRTVMVPVIDPHIAHVYRAKEALNYDAVSKKGFVTPFDKAEHNRLMKAYKKLVSDTRRRYGAANKEFAARRGELTGLGFWNDYLGLDEGSGQMETKEE